MATSATLRSHAGSFAVAPSSAASRRSLRHWMPAMVALAVILLESQNVFGAARTSEWLAVCLPRGMDGADAWRLNILLRKTGHVCGYGMVALCLYRGWFAEQFYRRPGLRRMVSWIAVYRRPAVWAVLCTAGLAGLDELHQRMLPARTASLRDVLLDSAGAAGFVGVVFVGLLFRCLIGGSYRRWFRAFLVAPAVDPGRGFEAPLG
jgi:VanZ family protein